MQEYSETFKKRMVQRMSGLHPRSTTSLSDETGVSQAKLSRWLSAAGRTDDASKMVDRQTPKPHLRQRQRSAECELRLVLEASRASDAETGEFP